MFNHRYRYWIIPALTLYTYVNTVLCDVYYYFNIQIAWYYALVTILLVTALTWEGNRLAEKLVRKYITPAGRKVRFFSVFFIVGNIIAALAALISVWLIGGLVAGFPFERNANPLKLNLIYAVLVNLFFHLINAIYYFFQEYQRHWREVEQLRKISSQAQVQLVKSQINPHFLFNNLNVLSGMVIKDNPEANHFIEEFSKVYRYVLNNQEKELVPLSAELDFIKPYLFLLTKRFDEGLIVEIDVPVKHQHYLVIPVALQMLIENAIKHNVVSAARPLRIEIFTAAGDALTVRNNLQPRLETEASTQIGLKNIQQRYELISGRAVMVKRTEGIFEVTVPLLIVN